MPFDFPDAPTLDQSVLASNGQTYIWDGAKWVTSGGQSIDGGATISDTPPTVEDGALWWDSGSSLQLYVGYDDGTSQQWVAANSVTGGPYLPLSGGTVTGAINVTSDYFLNSVSITKKAVYVSVNLPAPPWTSSLTPIMTLPQF